MIEEEGLVARSRDVGAAWRDALSARLASHPGVREVRGRGLMIGIALDSTERALRAVSTLLARGYIVLAAGPRGSVLQLTPPLTIDVGLLEGFTDAVGAALG